MEHGMNGTNCHQEWPGLFFIREEMLLVNNIEKGLDGEDQAMTNGGFHHGERGD